MFKKFYNSIELISISVLFNIFACSNSTDSKTDDPVSEPKFAFIAIYNGSYELLLLNRPNNKITNLTNSKEQERFEFQFSPDGSKILYSRYESNYVDLCIMNLDGSSLEILDSGFLSPIDAKFAPDGENIIYSKLVDSNLEVLMMNLYTKEITNISNLQRVWNYACHDENPLFSNDGTKLAFASMRDTSYWTPSIRYQIYMTSPESDTAINISRIQGNANNPKFSYDDKYILFTNYTIYKRQIYSIRLHDRAYFNLTTNLNISNYKYDVSPISNLIVFSSPRDNDSDELYCAEINGNNTYRLTDISPNPQLNNGNAFYPSFNHDGSKVVFVFKHASQFGAIHTINIDGSSHQEITSVSFNDIKYPKFLPSNDN